VTVRILALAVLLVVPVTDLARAADRGHPKVELLKVLNRLMLPLTTDPGVGRAWHLDVVGEVDGNKGSVELAWDGRARHYLRVGGDDLPGATAVFGASRSSLWVPAHGKLFTASHAPVDATTLLADEKAWRALLRQAPVLAGVGALLLLPSDLDMTLDDDGTLEAAVADEFALRIRRGAKSGALTLELRLGTSSETIARIDVRKCSRVPVAEFDKLLAAAPVAGDGAAVEEVDIVHLRGMLRTLGDLGAEKLLARINPKLVPDPLADVPRVDGVPFVRLEGTPEEMGKRHGEVLRDGVHYNVHRTLHGVGFLATVSTGKWFPGELARAWSATERFIPKRHVREIDATSAAAGLPRDWGRHLSVFPEIFHCSGIAVRGKATVDGKIYHGRVLDYMTHIGLQNSAVVTLHRPDGGRHAWINVGYAGLCGTVTAMNAAGLTMGEMGGRGEGYWDGMPMTFLMREVVERFDTTKDALAWMRSTPRTCEYFYVLSDARTRSMAGVASYAAKLAAERQITDFRVIEPGVAYDELPRPIADAVLMSAGTRYDCLVDRVRAGYGKLDMQGVWDLMGAGVGMTSCLHTALFAPESLELWVAQAGPNGEPAYTQRIAKLDMRRLLEQAKTVADAR